MVAVVRAKPGAAIELRAAIVELTAAVRQEPGCRVLLLGHVHRFFTALEAYSTTTADGLFQLVEVPVA